VAGPLRQATVNPDMVAAEGDAGGLIMLSGVNHVSSTATSNQSSPSTRQPAPQVKSQSSNTDTVTLSPAAQLQQELTETPAQTGQEARQGDIQAKNLQAREAAAQRNGL
jgi:hypothetical protein